MRRPGAGRYEYKLLWPQLAYLIRCSERKLYPPILSSPPWSWSRPILQKREMSDLTSSRTANSNHMNVTAAPVTQKQAISLQSNDLVRRPDKMAGCLRRIKFHVHIVKRRPTIQKNVTSQSHGESSRKRQPRAVCA